MVQGLEVVDETRREAHDVGHDGDEVVGDRGKSGAKVKEEQGGVKGRVSGLGKEASLSLARNEVVFASLGVNGDNVVDSLAPYGKAVLLLVCPIFDGVGEFTIDRRSNSFVVGVFKAQRSGLVGSSFDAVFCVVIFGTFGKKDSEVDVESRRGDTRGHHVEESAVEGFGASGASGEPCGIRYAVGAGCAVFGLFEEVE